MPTGFQEFRSPPCRSTGCASSWPGGQGPREAPPATASSVGALPLQARGHGGDQRLRPRGAAAGPRGTWKSSTSPTSSAPRCAQADPGFEEKAAAYLLSAPGPHRRPHSDPTRPLHLPGPAGLARVKRSSGGHARRAQYVVFTHREDLSGGSLQPSTCATLTTARSGAGGRVRGPLLRLRQRRPTGSGRRRSRAD